MILYILFSFFCNCMLCFAIAMLKLSASFLLMLSGFWSFWSSFFFCFWFFYCCVCVCVSFLFFSLHLFSNLLYWMYHMQFSFVFLYQVQASLILLILFVCVYSLLILKLHFVEFRSRSECSSAAMLAARNSPLLVSIFLLGVCFLTVQILNY